MQPPITYHSIHEKTRALAEGFRFITRKTIGKSYLGREIEVLSFGYGQKSLIMTACHHGSEHLTASLLMDFAEELALSIESGDSRFALKVRSLLEYRRLILLPCVNPDGMALATEGLTTAFPNADRLVKLNGNSRDFSHWQANARGVDLNHNYDYRFGEYKRLEKEHNITQGPTRFAGEYPESENETRAVCRLVREEGRDLAAVLSFHSQGEVIYYHDTPITRHGAHFLSRLSGYTPCRADGLAAYGGLTDWLSAEGIPAFTMEIGKGENPLPDTLAPLLYATLREMLFRTLAFF